MTNRISRLFETPTPVGGEDDFQRALSESPEFKPAPVPEVYTSEQVTEFGWHQWELGFEFGRRWEREESEKSAAPRGIVHGLAVSAVLVLAGVAVAKWFIEKFWY